MVCAGFMLSVNPSPKPNVQLHGAIPDENKIWRWLQKCEHKGIVVEKETSRAWVRMPDNVECVRLSTLQSPNPQPLINHVYYCTRVEGNRQERNPINTTRNIRCKIQCITLGKIINSIRSISSMLCNSVYISFVKSS